MKTSKTLSPKQKKIAQVAGDPNKIEAEDFKKLRTMKANEGIFTKLKKLKKEEKKDLSYSNIPIDHSDVDLIKEIDDKERGVKYSDKETKFKNKTGLDGPEMNENRKKAKRFVDYMQGKATRKLTATQGSFRMGGAAIKGKGAVARDRGMGLQDENISVGKGADYIKDLI